MQQTDSNFILSLIGLVLTCIGVIATVIIYIINMKGDSRVQAERLKALKQELDNQKLVYEIQLAAVTKYSDHLTEEGIKIKADMGTLGTSITKLEGKTDSIFGMVKEMKSIIDRDHNKAA